MRPIPGFYVGGKGEDKGMHFRYYWAPLDSALDLAGGQATGLRFLKQQFPTSA